MAVAETERKKRIRDGWRAAGECTACGGGRDANGFVCQACLDTAAERRRGRRRLKCCPACGKSAYSIILGENYKVCPDCRHQNRQRRKVYVANGLCACGKPRKPNRASCEQCLADRAERAKRYRESRRCKCRKPVRPGTKKNGKPYFTCEPCLIKARKSYERKGVNR